MTKGAADQVPEAETQIRRVSAILDRLNWGHALLISVIGAASVGMVVYLFLPRQYSAGTSLLFSRRPDIVTMLNAASADSGARSALLSLTGSDPRVYSFEIILRSRRITGEIARKFGIAEKFHLTEVGAARQVREMTSVSRRGNLTTVVGLEIGVTVPGPSRAAELLGRPVPLTTGQAAQLAADIANEYVVNLEAYLAQSDRGAASENRVFVEKRIDEVSAQLSEIEDRLESLQTEYALIEPAKKSEHLMTRMNAVAQAHTAAKAEARDLSNALGVARAQLEQQDLTRIEQEVTTRNPLITSLGQKLAEQKVEMAELQGAGLTAAHPDVVALRAAIDKTEAELDGLAEEVRSTITRQVNPAYDALLGDVVKYQVQSAGARAREAVYQGEQNQIDGQLADLPPVAREYMQLSRDQQIKSELLALLSKNLEFAAMQEKVVSTSQFEVLDVAEPPTRKSAPSTVRITAAAFAVLFAASLLFVAWRRGVFRIISSFE
ncbi:MAG TPA: hypothetical protein DGT21_20250 [Armatimonadetes bacterium]|nr:hypothetical protein [Armatimonadota bacterium]